MREHGHTPPPEEFLQALSAWGILQARLPLRRGGLGLTSALDTSPAAYLGGQAVCAQFLHRQVGAHLPYTGAQYAEVLATAAHPHCFQLRRAWADCGAAIAANQRDDLLITLDEVIGCEAVAERAIVRTCGTPTVTGR
eukprot:COSAG02_NODE_12_length_58022_cov_242.077379_12_plen_138_part_00